ncbi:hypothetical protein [Rhodoferax sp.]|uniref:hypothetical protein n=1 Tax=Rhodoferax sp. TaxID=50421 RepID=UPI0026377B36|nr:hypothetical protein [Rhodoferax sp.]MDD2917430.1 hypothetical protein [Rhodoferax sp.]
MMKEFIQSFIPFTPLPCPPFRAALGFAGPLRAFAKMSAKGFPLGTIPGGGAAPAKGGFLSIERLWITFAAPAFCQLPKKWAQWIRFASA